MHSPAFSKAKYDDGRKYAPMQKSLSLYAILRRMLSELNEQVVDHGDRVAYLYLKMQEYRQTANRPDMDDMMLACYAHDIGAYKTEKFIDLLKFDVTNTMEHCLYGYLFMKFFSALGEKAQVLIYHHTYYSEKDKYSGRYLDDGILIHFLDRIDIFNIKHEDPDDVLWQAKNGSGRNFDPADVADFLAANEKYHILENLRDGSYRVDVMEFFNDPDRIERMIRPVINMLAYEIDFRSEQTVIHSVTTAKIAQLLGQRAGLSEQEILYLQYAAQLHDLGKIDIPTQIVEKPGRLTPDEYSIMKKHTVFTEMIISELFPDEIVRIAARHHERLDGSGYPKGLTAESLTLSDRIMQVADVTSALLQKRSYKQAMDKKTVISILTEEAEAGKLDAGLIAMLIAEYDALIAETMTAAEEVIHRYENLHLEYACYLNRYSQSAHETIEEFPLLSRNK